MIKLPEQRTSTCTPRTVTVRVGFASRELANDLVIRWRLAMQRDVWDFLVSVAFESGLEPAEIAERLGVQADDNEDSDSS